MEALNRDKVVAVLNRIMECELVGVIRYTYYSLMVCGYNGDPVAAWLRAQAEEGLVHAQRAGKLLSLLGAKPTPAAMPPQAPYANDIEAILRESLEHENEACEAYRDLLRLSQGHSIFIEDYARQLIVVESAHAEQVDRLLNVPCTVTPYAA